MSRKEEIMEILERIEAIKVQQQNEVDPEMAEILNEVVIVAEDWVDRYMSRSEGSL